MADGALRVLIAVAEPVQVSPEPVAVALVRQVQFAECGRAVAVAAEMAHEAGQVVWRGAA
jgi:hypothetical protein